MARTQPQASQQAKAQDPVAQLINRVAEAVVRKLEERQKIDAIAQAVIAQLEEKAPVDRRAYLDGGGKRQASRQKTRVGKTRR